MVPPGSVTIGVLAKVRLPAVTDALILKVPSSPPVLDWSIVPPAKAVITAVGFGKLVTALLVFTGSPRFWFVTLRTAPGFPVGPASCRDPLTAKAPVLAVYFKWWSLDPRKKFPEVSRKNPFVPLSSPAKVPLPGVWNLPPVLRIIWLPIFNLFVIVLFVKSFSALSVSLTITLPSNSATTGSLKSVAAIPGDDVSDFADPVYTRVATMFAYFTVTLSFGTILLTCEIPSGTAFAITFSPIAAACVLVKVPLNDSASSSVPSIVTVIPSRFASTTLLRVTVKFPMTALLFPRSITWSVKVAVLTVDVAMTAAAEFIVITAWLLDESIFTWLVRIPPVTPVTETP